MPILEDGLSSGHASDTENNLPLPGSGISIVMDQHQHSAGTVVGAESSAQTGVEQESGYPFISSIMMAAEQQQQQQQQHDQQVDSSDEVQEAIKDIKAALQKTKILPSTEGTSALDSEQHGADEAASPVWVPRF